MWDNQILFNEGNASLCVPLCVNNPYKTSDDVLYVGSLHGHACYAVQVSAENEMTGLTQVGLRNSYDQVEEDFYLMAGRAWQLIYWDRRSKHCGCCGRRTERHEQNGRRCFACGEEYFPVISPAIIVLISRGDEVLLVRARNFRGGFYGLVAGFVEVGESLEACVMREVMEETGMSVRNIRYFGSQTWPYPSGLMVGFTAEYAGGELHIQEEELVEADFYRYDQLPELSPRLSLGRRLIDAWVEEVSGKYGSKQDV